MGTDANRLATIDDLEVNTSTRLTGEIKKALIAIVEDEYRNQTTLSSQAKADAEAEVIREYSARYGVEALVDEHISLRAKADAVSDKLRALGFSTSGDMLAFRGQSTLNPKGKAMLDAIDRVQERFQAPRTEKNKIVARLQLAGTYGEALVILKAVMGNGLLPEVRVDQLSIAHD